MLLLALLACHPRYPDFDALRYNLAEEAAAMESATLSRPLPADMDLRRTTWKLRYVDDDAEGLVEYNLHFGPDGVMQVGNPADTTAGNDTWRQLGHKLVFSFNDAYVTYTGAMSDRHHAEGSAVNVRGERWSWTLERQELQPEVGWDPELGVHQWLLAYASPLDGQPRQIWLEFRSGGTLYSSESEGTEGHAWSRPDGGLRFSFDEDYAVYTAAPAEGGWTGQAQNVDQMTWDFTLTRTEEGATDRRIPPAGGALHAAEGEALAALVAGSSWRVTDYDPVQPTDFSLTFGPGGVLTRTELGGSNPTGSDTWEAAGHEVIFRINDGFTEHRCLPLDDNSMIGWARNQDGHEWSYTLTRE